MFFFSISLLFRSLFPRCTCPALPSAPSAPAAPGKVLSLPSTNHVPPFNHHRPHRFPPLSRIMCLPRYHPPLSPLSTIPLIAPMARRQTAWSHVLSVQPPIHPQMRQEFSLYPRLLLSGAAITRVALRRFAAAPVSVIDADLPPQQQATGSSSATAH